MLGAAADGCEGESVEGVSTTVMMGSCVGISGMWVMLGVSIWVSSGKGKVGLPFWPFESFWGMVEYGKMVS